MSTSEKFTNRMLLITDYLGVLGCSNVYVRYNLVKQYI